MIIDSTYFSSYLEASKLTISRLDDPAGDFWLKDWFDDFKHKESIFVHCFPQQNSDIEEIIKFCLRHLDHIHIIILSGQSVPMKKLQKLISTQEKIYVLNDYGFSDNKFLPVISSHRTFGKGYINKVPFVPWSERKYTLSSLSSRYEPHRWIVTSHLHSLKRKDFVYSFHNGYPMAYDVKHFIATAKDICNYDVGPVMASSVQDLIDKAPIIPAGMNNPMPNGKDDPIVAQCEMQVYLDSKINLTMEGQFVDTGYGCNITEKTMKCLASGCFPLHVGQSGFYRFLSSMGFNFDTKLDLSYDEAPQDNRKAKLDGVMSNINNLTTTSDLETVCKQNYEWFHNGWYDSCEKQNRVVLAELKRRIYEQI